MAKVTLKAIDLRIPRSKWHDLSLATANRKSEIPQAAPTRFLSLSKNQKSKSQGTDSRSHSLVLRGLGKGTLSLINIEVGTPGLLGCLPSFLGPLPTALLSQVAA